MRHGHGLLSRSARRAAPTLAGAVLCAVGLGGFGGCGDGGSSGFDIAASQRQEQEVIAEAAHSGTCTELSDGLICGARMPIVGPLQPALTDPVSLSPSTAQPLPCIGDAATGCTVTIRIAGGQLSGSGEALRAGSTLLAAVGPVDPPNGWVRGTAVTYAQAGEAQAELHLTLVPGGRVPLVTGTLVRVAVPVYSPSVGVPDVPVSVNLLSDFDAEVAVVANDLVLQVSAAARP
jgi:hypothetical protein